MLLSKEHLLVFAELVELVNVTIFRDVRDLKFLFRRLVFLFFAGVFLNSLFLAGVYLTGVFLTDFFCVFLANL